MATIKVVRFNNKQGKRKYDRAAVVSWNIHHDDVNHRLIIQTEETRYYIMDPWIFSFLGKEEEGVEVTVLKRKTSVRSSADTKKAA